MRPLIFLASVVLATLPHSAFAASYFEAGTYWNLSVADDIWKNTGELEHKGDWYFGDSHSDGYGNIEFGYMWSGLTGTALSFKGSSDFGDDWLDHSYMTAWDRNIYEHSFANTGEDSLTVDILLSYSVTALAAVDNPSPGDFAKAWAGIHLSFYAPTGTCSGVPRLTQYVASVDTQTGRSSESYSGSQLFQLQLDPGARCFMTIDKEHEGTTLARFATPAAVPVPASALLLGSALAGLGALGRRRRHS